MTLDFFERFRENREQLPEQVAFQYISEEERESFSYDRIGQEIAKISLFLSRFGVHPGDAVGILMENHPRWGIAFLAAQSSGAMVVPFDIVHSTETLAELIQHSKCKFLISTKQFVPKLKEIQTRLPNPLPVLISGGSFNGAHSWDHLLEQIRECPPLPLVTRDLDEPLVIIYTSGTTGNPKGVVLTQRNLYRTTVEVLKAIHVSSRDHLLCVLPLYHVLALMVNFIIPLYTGAQVTYLDTIDAQRILRCFREERITIFVCVPQFYYLVHRRILQEIGRQILIKRFLFRSLLKLSNFCNEYVHWSPGKLFFSVIHKKFGHHFRFFGVGGARFDPEIARSFRNLGFGMIQAYGMTETAAIATLALPGSHGVGSVGVPLPHVQLRIDAPDGNGIGEVWIRGENVMSGYWENPEETAEILHNGWLCSGDLGFLSADGFLYITGRKKDVIVLSSGKNIFPEEVEHFYQSNCPLIKEMCVLGVADQSTSEAREKLHAVIVPDFDYLKSQQIVNIAGMIRYKLETVSQRLPSYKRVHSFDIQTDPLARTTTRKIKRFQVQRTLEQTPKRDLRPALTENYIGQTKTERRVFEIIRQMKQVPAISQRMNLELDLGFDSLERVELLSTTQEAFQIEIRETDASGIFTVEELVSAIEKQLSTGQPQGEEVLLSWAQILSQPLKLEDEQKVEEILVSNPLVELLFYLTAKLIHLLCRVFFRLKIDGRENLPHQYPFLICPNHLSFVDVFVVVAALPYRTIRRLFFLGYSPYFRGKIMSFLGRLIKVIPVDPDRNLRQALALGAEGLRRKLILCVFPEGERSIDGSLKRFRKGPAILAAHMEVPVVPTAIRGTYEIWRRGSNKFRIRPIQIIFGKPLAPPIRESHHAFNDRLAQSVAELIQRKE